MKTYEGMFLVDSRKANRDWDETVAAVTSVLEKCGAAIARLEKWGERKLAYPINKQTRGVYVLIYFEAADDNETAVTDIYRQVEISDTIMRAMIIRIKEVPAEGGTAAEEESAEKESADAAESTGEETESDEEESGDEAADAAESTEEESVDA